MNSRVSKSVLSLLALTPFLLLFVAACGSSNGGGGASGVVGSGAWDGIWQMPCVDFPSADPNVHASANLESVVRNQSMRTSVRNYDSAGCQGNPRSLTETHATFVVQGSYGGADLVAVDLTERQVLRTYYGIAATQAGQDAECGIRNWRSAESRDVTRADCSADDRIDQVQYGTYKIVNGELFVSNSSLVQTPAGGGVLPGSTPETRVTAFDSIGWKRTR